ncbi:MAG TPA: LacI family DNA-binding transcriptional regulator [Armatimonadota bacterium]|nr:LacI family DNA-binding transcriptional regulator [Armatimonadota bacterium]
MANKKTTIKDIARDCGVGLGTVSRAINGQPGVKDEVRRKILQYIEDVGWRSNSLYPRLKISEAGQTVVFIASTSTLERKFDNDLPRMLIEQVIGSGFSPVVLYGQSRENLERCVAIKPYAVILIGVSSFQKEPVEALLNSGIRVVGVGECDDFAGPLVFPAHREAARRAVTVLKNAGHEQIGFLGGMGIRKKVGHVEDIAIRRIREILYGICDAHPGFDVTADAVSDCFSDLDGLRRKLKTGHHTAWLCSDEKMCRQFLYCAAELNIAIPDEVSLVSFTPDLPFYSFTHDVTRFYPDNAAQAARVRELLEADAVVQPEICLSDCLFHQGATVTNLNQRN